MAGSASAAWTMMVTMTSQPPPLAACLLALGVQRVLTRSAMPTPRSRRAGAVAGAASVALLVGPVAAFRRKHTTVDPRADAAPSALVTTGVNAVSRNPMYLGMIGLLVAGALRRPAPPALLPLLAFFWWLDRVQVPGEEAVLQSQFGEQYERYRSRVPRWVAIQPSRIARSARR